MAVKAMPSTASTADGGMDSDGDATAALSSSSSSSDRLVIDLGEIDKTTDDSDEYGWTRTPQSDTKAGGDSSSKQNEQSVLVNEALRDLFSAKEILAVPLTRSATHPMDTLANGKRRAPKRFLSDVAPTHGHRLQPRRKLSAAVQKNRALHRNRRDTAPVLMPVPGKRARQNTIPWRAKSIRAIDISFDRPKRCGVQQPRRQTLAAKFGLMDFHIEASIRIDELPDGQCVLFTRDEIVNSAELQTIFKCRAIVNKWKPRWTHLRYCHGIGDYDAALRGDEKIDILSRLAAVRRPMIMMRTEPDA